LDQIHVFFVETRRLGVAGLVPEYRLKVVNELCNIRIFDVETSCFERPIDEGAGHKALYAGFWEGGEKEG
jgi:hypothetical protein